MTLVPELLAQLPAGRVVLEAPPGAGKSTSLPLALLAAPSLHKQTIIMLQPRRLAALSIARFLSDQLGEAVGQTVGYQIRGQTKRSQNTRLLIVTEGIFTRLIQADPELTGVGLVIFDEFHERHLHSDLGLAMLLETLNLRPELSLLVMSATLPAQIIADWLSESDGIGDCKVLRTAGRQFPVSVQYRPPGLQYSWEQTLPKVVAEALSLAERGVLVFLPGRGEINRLQQRLAEQLPANVSLSQLHSQVPIAEQQQVLQPLAEGQLRLVLATNIAETSLTIPGIDVVVDSGRVRQAHFYPQHGVTRLLTRRVSSAAATQRAGRAGRVSDGVCLRLWAESDQHGLADYAPAEIGTQDLTQLLLECREWGNEPEQMQFLTAPNRAHLQVADKLLQQLQAVTPQHQLTPLGSQLGQFGSDPRLARLGLWAAEQSAINTRAQAALVAAVLETPPQSQMTDFVSLLQALLEAGGKHPAMPAQFRQRLQWWQQRLNAAQLPEHLNGIANVLLWAFPDRIAQRRGQSARYLMAYGGGAMLDEADPLAQSSLLLAPVLTLAESAADAVIRWALPITEADLQHPLVPWQKHEEAAWQGPQQRLELQEVETVGAICLRRRATPVKLTAEHRLQALASYAREHGWRSFKDDPATAQLLARIRLLSEFLPANEQWPDFSEAALLVELEDWAVPYWQQLDSLTALASWSPYAALLARLTYPQQQVLQQQCPVNWQAPSGRSVTINYLNEPPLVAVKLQEAFGEPVSPKIVYDKVTLTLDLLSPAGRLLQRTGDLASFWQNAYQDVKKEMKGRYPKHPWPDNPVTAIATQKTSRQLRHE